MSRVLIIEDETAYQKVLKDTFEKGQFEVALASDIKQGIAEIAKVKPDIILLDIILPGGVNGFDFLEQIKADKNTRDIPVIVITNLASEEKVAKDIGASYYFTKSDTKIEQIMDKVKQILSNESGVKGGEL